MNFNYVVELAKVLAEKMNSRHLLGSVAVLGIVIVTYICTNNDDNQAFQSLVHNNTSIIPDENNSDN